MGETRREAIMRLQNKLLGDVPVNFNYNKDETRVVESQSESFPGIKTIYRKEIVEGFISITNPAQIATVGLAGSNDATFTVQSAKGERMSEYAWLSEEQVQEKAVELRFDGPELRHG